VGIRKDQGYVFQNGITIILCSCNQATGPNGVPFSCEQYYSQDDGFFNATVRGMVRRTLDEISIELSMGNGPCVDLILRYLCYYYFPVCNQITGVVTQSCTNSCNLLVNNQTCLNFLRDASMRMEQVGILAPDTDCQMTFATVELPDEVSDNCIAVEGQFEFINTWMYVFMRVIDCNSIAGDCLYM